MTDSVQPAKTVRRSHVWWYAIGASLVLIGIIAAAPVSLVWFLKNKTPSTQFLTPGTKEIEIVKPGKYYLWFDYQTIYKGQSFNSSEEIPNGLKFRLVELSSRNTIEMTSDFSCKVSSNDCQSKSVGRFQIESPGKYLISVDGDSPERIFSFSGDTIGILLKTMIRGALIVTIGVGAGLVACVFGLICQLRR
jgi:hypothetical protein